MCSETRTITTNTRNIETIPGTLIQLIDRFVIPKQHKNVFPRNIDLALSSKSVTEARANFAGFY